MLGIRSSLPVVEVIAYVLYAVPMLLVVLWPPRRTPTRAVLGRILVGTAAIALVVAGLIAALGPGAPVAVTGTQGPFVQQGTSSGGTDPATGTPVSGSVVTGTAVVTMLEGAGSVDINSESAGATVSLRSSPTA